MFRRSGFAFRGLSIIFMSIFTVSLITSETFHISEAHAAVVGLPQPGTMVSLSGKYSLPVLKGLKIDVENPMNLNFIIDSNSKDDVTSQEASKLVSYFLAALTIDKENIWVNLSPYEQERITDPNLAITDLGKDLLEQDYILKQLAASLTHPETDTGKKYWHSNSANADLSKIWIVPEIAKIYEANNSVFVTQMIFDVQTKAEEGNNDALNSILSEVKKDVNGGKNFANLRQIFYSIALAEWFKTKLKDSVFKHYINQNKVSGIDIKDKTAKDKIWAQYVESFEKGAYDSILKVKDSYNGSIKKKKYFSGGSSAVQLVLNNSSFNEAKFDGNAYYAKALLETEVENDLSSAINLGVIKAMPMTFSLKRRLISANPDYTVEFAKGFSTYYDLTSETDEESKTIIYSNTKYPSGRFINLQKVLKNKNVSLEELVVALKSRFSEYGYKTENLAIDNSVLNPNEYKDTAVSNAVRIVNILSKNRAMLLRIINSNTDDNVLEQWLSIENHDYLTKFVEFSQDYFDVLEYIHIDNLIDVNSINNADDGIKSVLHNAVINHLNNRLDKDVYFTGELELIEKFKTSFDAAHQLRFDTYMKERNRKANLNIKLSEELDRLYVRSYDVYSLVFEFINENKINVEEFDFSILVDYVSVNVMARDLSGNLIVEKNVKFSEFKDYKLKLQEEISPVYGTFVLDTDNNFDFLKFQEDQIKANPNLQKVFSSSLEVNKAEQRERQRTDASNTMRDKSVGYRDFYYALLNLKELPKHLFDLSGPLLLSDEYINQDVVAAARNLRLINKNQGLFESLATAPRDVFETWVKYKDTEFLTEYVGYLGGFAFARDLDYSELMDINSFDNDLAKAKAAVKDSVAKQVQEKILNAEITGEDIALIQYFGLQIPSEDQIYLTKFSSYDYIDKFVRGSLKHYSISEEIQSKIVKLLFEQSYVLVDMEYAKLFDYIDHNGDFDYQYFEEIIKASAVLRKIRFEIGGYISPHARDVVTDLVVASNKNSKSFDYTQLHNYRDGYKFDLNKLETDLATSASPVRAYEAAMNLRQGWKPESDAEGRLLYSYLKDREIDPRAMEDFLMHIVEDDVSYDTKLDFAALIFVGLKGWNENPANQPFEDWNEYARLLQEAEKVIMAGKDFNVLHGATSADWKIEAIEEGQVSSVIELFSNTLSALGLIFNTARYSKFFNVQKAKHDLIKAKTVTEFIKAISFMAQYSRTDQVKKVFKRLDTQWPSEINQLANLLNIFNENELTLLLESLDADHFDLENFDDALSKAYELKYNNLEFVVTAVNKYAKKDISVEEYLKGLSKKQPMTLDTLDVPYTIYLEITPAAIDKMFNYTITEDEYNSLVVSDFIEDAEDYLGTILKIKFFLDQKLNNRALATELAKYLMEIALLKAQNNKTLDLAQILNSIETIYDNSLEATNFSNEKFIHEIANYVSSSVGSFASFNKKIQDDLDTRWSDERKLQYFERQLADHEIRLKQAKANSYAKADLKNNHKNAIKFCKGQIRSLKKRISNKEDSAQGPGNNKGGVDAKGLTIETSALSSAIEFKSFDPVGFKGFRFKITKLESVEEEVVLASL